MLRSMLACCKLYISESRNASSLHAIEQAVKLHPEAVLVNKFTDESYNRVGYTLVSSLSSPLEHAVFGMVRATFEAFDFSSHSGTHPRLGSVDHICFHPLAQATLDHVAVLARRVAAHIGQKLQGLESLVSIGKLNLPMYNTGAIDNSTLLVACNAVPTFLYGAAHREGRTLASIRRQLGYFKPNYSGKQWAGAWDAETLHVAPDEGPNRLPRSQGVVVVGATRWVDNYNVPLYTSDVVAVRRIARAVRERGGGLFSVQAMGLAHGVGVTEVACNLLDPEKVGADQVQERVQQLADAEGLAAGKGYFTDFSQEKVVQLYLESTKNSIAETKW